MAALGQEALARDSPRHVTHPWVTPRCPHQIPELDPSEVDWHCVTGCDTSATVSTLNVRVDPGTAAFLDRLARESGRSRSDVVREALEALREHGVRRPAVPPAEAMAHLIGCWDSGGKRLSERTGERFAQLLREKSNGHHASRRRAAGRSD